MLKSIGVEKKKAFENFLKKETFYEEKDEISQKLKEIAKSFLTKTWEEESDDSDEEEVEEEQNLLVNAVFKRKKKVLQEYLEKLKKAKLESSYSQLKDIFQLKDSYKDIEFTKIIKKLRSLVQKDDKKELRKFFEKQVKKNLEKVLEIWNFPEFKNLEVKKSNKFLFGVAMIQKNEIKPHIKMVLQIYEKLEEFENYREIPMGFPQTNEQSAFKMPSLIDLFEDSVSDLPLEYLSSNPKFAETIMERTWYTILCKQSEKFCIIIKLRLLKVLDLSFEKVNLEHLNEVCLSLKTDKVLEWLNGKHSYERNFGEKVLNLTMGNIKKSQQLSDIVKILSQAEDSKNFKEFLSEKWLVEWLLSFSEPEVRIRTLMPISQSIAVPLKFQDQKFFKKYKSVQWDWNFELEELIHDSYGIVNVSIGPKAGFGLKSEMLLNNCFATKFDTSEKGLNSDGSVDINLDTDLSSSRDFTFINIYGESKDTDTLEELKALANIVLVQVSQKDLKIENTIRMIKKIKDKGEEALGESGKKGYIMLLIVREAKISSDNEAMCQKKEQEIAEGLNETGVEAKDVIIFRDQNKNESLVLSGFERRLVVRVVDCVKSMASENPQQKVLRGTFGPFIMQQLGIKIENEDISKKNKILNRNSSQDQKNFDSDEKTSDNESQVKHNLPEKPQSDRAEEKGGQEIYQKNREREIQNLLNARACCRNFIQTINEHTVDKEKMSDLLPFNKLLRRKRHIRDEIRKHQTETDNLVNLEEKLTKINQEIEQQQATILIQKFLEIIEHPQNAIILIILFYEIKTVNDRVVGPSRKKMEQLTTQLAVQKASKEGNTKVNLNKALNEEKKKEIIELDIKIMDLSLSMDTLFRNLLPYLQQNKTLKLDVNRKSDIKRKLFDLMKKGFNLELVNGNSLEYKADFLINHLKCLKKEKVCVISILGPQSSGKSTLLNFMFGTLFHTSTGRCTSGLYLSLQRFENPENDVKWILIVDTEGLHSAEREDPEYDRKICSFILTNSDIILVTVKGEISLKMKEDLEITLYSSSEIKSFTTMPQIHFVFNQNQNNEDKSPFKKQIMDLNNNILDLNEDYHEAEENKEGHKQNQIIPKTFQLKDEFIWVFGNAFDHTKIEALKMGTDSDCISRSVSKDFGVSVGELANKIIQKIKNNEVSKYFTFPGIYLQKAGERWRIIEKYSGLTREKDLKSLKNRLKLEELMKQWKPELLSQIDRLAEKNLKEWNQKLKDIKSIPELENYLYQNLKEDLIDFTNKWEAFEKEREKESIDKNVKVNLFKNSIDQLHKGFDLKLESFKLSIQTLVQSNKFRIYSIKSPIYFIQMAKDLKLRLENLNKKSDLEKIELQIKETFENSYEDFKKEQKENLGLSLVYQKTFKVIHRMAKNLTPYTPEQLNCCPGKTKIVTVEWMYEHLRRFLDKRVGCFIVDQIELSQLNHDFTERFRRSNQKFMDLSNKFELFIEVRVIKCFQTNFKPDVLKQEIKKVISSEMQDEIKVEGLLDIKRFLLNNRIDIDLPERIDLLKKFKDQNMEKFGENLFSERRIVCHLPYNQKEFKFNLAGKYFNVEISKVTLKDYQKLQSKMKNNEIFWVGEISREQEIKNMEPTSNEGKNLKTCLYFWKYENQTRVQNSMREVLQTHFDFKLVVKKIEQICIDKVYEYSQSMESDSESNSEYDKSNIDFERASELSYELLQMIARQELNLLIQEMEKEMGVCAVKVDSALKGFLIYIALFFLWKLMVDVKSKQIENNLDHLENEKENYFKYFKSIVLNNKEEKMMQEIKIKIHSCVKEYWEMKLVEAAQEFNKKVSEEGLDQFQSKKIIKKLEEEYYKNVQDHTFEKVFEFMTDPNKIFKEKIKDMKKTTFFDTAKELDERLKVNLKKEILFLSTVLEELQEGFVVKGKETNQSILNDFQVYDHQNEEIKVYKDKESHIDSISSAAFQLLVDFIQGESISNEYPDTALGLKMVFKFNLAKLNQIREKIEKNLEKLSKNRSLSNSKNKKSLSEDLFKILQNCETKQIFSFQSFFKRCFEVFREVETEYQGKKLNLKDFDIEKEFNQAGTSALGCQHKCPFCSKKCEYLGTDDNHKHHTESSGHQLRVFNKAYIEINKEKIPSLLTCDVIKKEKQILWNGCHMSWEEAFNRSSENWEKNLGRDMLDVKPQIENYENVWAIHGKEICEKFKFSHPNTTVTEFIQEYNRNKSIRPNSHYFIGLDDSGSMWGDKFKTAKKGTIDFIRNIRSQLGSSECWISYYLFHWKNYEIVRFKNIEEIDGDLKNIECRSGWWTNFKAILDQAIEVIEQNCNEVSVHRVLIYTDGEAGYPEYQINTLKELLDNNPNLDFKLFWVSEDPKENEVFKRCRQELGENRCEFFTGVPTDEIESTFTEIFENDIYEEEDEIHSIGTK